jgi:AmmeMemoRadiSam system protein A
MKVVTQVLPRGEVPIAILLPHAPILVPEVAGERLADCRASVEAMQAAARRLVAAKPDAVVLVSPHAAREMHAYAMTSGGVSGSLARFGASHASVRLPGDAALTATLREAAAARGIDTANLPASQLDHGSVVPLWHLVQAGWDGPTVVLALAMEDNSRVAELGECVAAVAMQLGRRVAVVASGDMSHRLKPGAPCGYDPEAAKFDREFIAQLRRGATRGLAAAVEPLQENAAEDAVESTLFALGAAGWRAAGREVLGYEGPFGVGYGVAVLFDAAATPRGEVLETTGAAVAAGPAEDRLGRLPALARASIAAALDLPASLEAPRPGDCPGDNGVFVTLHDPAGRLRGCIGTMASHTDDLAVETWRMAREAALHDPRFSPVRPEELAGLRIEVTVLEPLEDIESAEALDPRRWGVVVRAADGRRGLLLPDIPEVTSVAQQISIARAKAGIGLAESVKLQRFAARRIEEMRP